MNQFLVPKLPLCLKKLESDEAVDRTPLKSSTENQSHLKTNLVQQTSDERRIETILIYQVLYCLFYL